jgi:hypothetical protein
MENLLQTLYSFDQAIAEKAIAEKAIVLDDGIDRFHGTSWGELLIPAAREQPEMS